MNKIQAARQPPKPRKSTRYGGFCGYCISKLWVRVSSVEQPLLPHEPARLVKILPVTCRFTCGSVP